MNLPQTGGCLCAGLRYEITRVPEVVYTCNCTDCQHLTGSAFSMALLVVDEAFQLSGFDPRPLHNIADSGRTNTRWLCPECGTWICSGPEPGAAPPGTLRSVRAGTLDDTSWLRPTIHFWIRSKQPWVILPHDGRSFEAQVADWAEVLSSPAITVPVEDRP
jgi:hypothetical protein